MTINKVTPADEKTNRQWAWQFLRRNRGYREAYAFLSSLNEEQQNIFQKLIFGQLGSYADNWSQLGSLPMKLFDCAYLWDEIDKNKTLDEYVNELHIRSTKIKNNTSSIAEKIDNLILRVAPEFRANEYGLFQWVDPSIEEITEDVANAIWSYSVPVEATLEREPLLDNKEINFEKSEWQGVDREFLTGNPKEAEIYSFSATEKFNRPVQAEALPLKKGVNGAIFMINNFSSPPLYGEVYGSQIPIGRNPEPLSLDGDTLVRATFDVRLPIEYQIEYVKNFLAEHQKELQEAGFFDPLPTRKSRRGVFSSYLEILDLHEQGVSDLDITIKLRKLEKEFYEDAQGKNRKNYVDPVRPDLATAQEHTSVIRKQLERARRLRDHGYRSLALQMD